MSLNKKILAVAIVSGLFATSAQAAVNIGVPSSVVTIASEINASVAAPKTITNVAGALDIQTGLAYAFSSGEVRYARVECSGNVKIDSGSAVTYTDGGGALGTASLGAINGLGTSAISFSVTSTAAGVGDNAGDIFTVTGNRTLNSTAASTCTYGLYDQPSQAAAGGTTGRIAVISGAYMNSASGYTFTATPNNTSTADVEASPAYSRFVVAAPTNSNLTAQLTAMNFDAASGTQLDINGTDATLTVLFGPTTSISVAGDFALAGGVAANVFLSNNADCSTKDKVANSVNATSASFTVSNVAVANDFLCVEVAGANTIAASTYTATLNAVSANATNYTVASTGPLAAGSIVRNGTQLQAPLVQVPSGYLARLVLTNTGNLARPYTIAVQGEDGNVISTANLTGTVPANGTRVIDLNTVLTGFTATPRATLNVTVAGPNNQVQGLYQIVNQAFGAVSNHVLVRPGTN